jgi:acetoacetyl-CoA reductase
MTALDTALLYDISYSVGRSLGIAGNFVFRKMRRLIAYLGFLTKEIDMPDSTNGKRIALVTGGMGGLGTPIARRLHDANYTTIVTHSEHNKKASTWLETERSTGRLFHSYEVDVAAYASCMSCVEQIERNIGTIDILINNAGIARDKTFMKMSKADWDAVLSTNLDAIFNMTKQVCKPMIERGWGRIINVGSVNGSRGAFGQVNYAASKAGLHGVTKTLALEFARRGVTVNTVSPGYLATAMVSAIPAEVLERTIIPQIPIGRLGEPDEVAALISFLCSDDAAFITGTNIAINGGMHMQ